MTRVPARAPDANGWYNQPLAVHLQRRPTPPRRSRPVRRPTYAGPDNPNASVSGTCTRQRRELRPSASYALKYDATPSKLSSVPSSRQASQWRSSTGSWPGSRRSIQVASARAGPEGRGRRASSSRGARPANGTIDRGLRPGREYHYQLTATDAAANKATKTLDFSPAERCSSRLRASASPRRLSSSGRQVRGASYYNVILVRGRRVFSAWPVQRAPAVAARLDVPRASLQTAVGHYQLVRLARLRLALGREVREVARRQHLHVRRLGLGGRTCADTACCWSSVSARCC